MRSCPPRSLFLVPGDDMKRSDRINFVRAAPQQRTAQARETDRMYEAILKLRRAGYHINRIGQGVHFFNGSIRSSGEILQMADSLT